MDHQVAHRRRRQVEAQRLPVRAVVEGDVHAALGTGEQQPAAHGIFPDDIDDFIRWDPLNDFSPRLSPVFGAIDVGTHIVEAEAVDRRVGFQRVDVGRLHQRHLAPRGERVRRHVRPGAPAVVRHPDQAVVGSGPKEVEAPERGGDRVHDAAVLAVLGVQRGEGAETAGHFGSRARQVRADHLPMPAAVHRLENDVAREIEDARVHRREQHGHGAHEAVLPRAHRIGRHVLDVTGIPVEPRQLAAVDQVGVQRVRRDVAVLLGAHRVPFADGDLPVVAAARHAGGARLLLPAVHPVGEAVVRRDVIELRGRLVVPGAPLRAAVDGDDRALIAGDEDDA